MKKIWQRILAGQGRSVSDVIIRTMKKLGPGRNTKTAFVSHHILPHPWTPMGCRLTTQATRLGSTPHVCHDEENDEMIGSDFIEMQSMERKRCSECGRNIEPKTNYLASIKRGKVKKIVCGEQCRLDFDDRFWQDVVDQKQ